MNNGRTKLHVLIFKLVITNSLNVDKEANIEPPIHEEYCMAGNTLILGPGGRRDVSSLCIRSENPGNIVLPPARTINGSVDVVAILTVIS